MSRWASANSACFLRKAHSSRVQNVSETATRQPPSSGVAFPLAGAAMGKREGVRLAAPAAGLLTQDEYRGTMNASCPNA